MVNEPAEPTVPDEAPVPAVADAPVTQSPLVILAADDAAVCVDDLCLPLEDRP